VSTVLLIFFGFILTIIGVAITHLAERQRITSKSSPTENAPKALRRESMLILRAE